MCVNPTWSACNVPSTREGGPTSLLGRVAFVVGWRVGIARTNKMCFNVCCRHAYSLFTLAEPIFRPLGWSCEMSGV